MKKTTVVKQLKSTLLALAMIRAKIKTADINWFAYCCTCWLFTHWTGLQGWHFMPQARGDSTRFELDNINQQCSWCNGKSNQWEQYKHWLYIDKTFGKWRADELHQQSHILRKWSITELEEAINDVVILIIEWYRIQTKEQQEILIGFIKKNNDRKRYCKILLEELGEI